MELWHALERLDQDHRNRKWGHPDVPPRIGPLLAVIKGSIHAEHPELYENFFGVAPEHYTPTSNAPLPLDCHLDGLNRYDSKLNLYIINPTS